MISLIFIFIIYIFVTYFYNIKYDLRLILIMYIYNIYNEKFYIYKFNLVI